MTFESRSKALKGISQVGRATFFCGGGCCVVAWSARDNRVGFRMMKVRMKDRRTRVRARFVRSGGRG